MAISLAAVAVICVVLIVLPVGPATMWPTLILLTVVATAVFLGMAVILAPIAELGLPSGICGSAMSVGSLLAYASVFWAYALNGHLIDAAGDDPRTGYRAIFIITAVVAAVGVVAAAILAVVNRRGHAPDGGSSHVVIPSLQNHQLITAHHVNQPVLISNATRPRTSNAVFEPLGLANS